MTIYARESQTEFAFPKIALSFIQQHRNIKNAEYTKMPNGTVKWFNTAKGFGFIEPEGGGADVFVHISAVEASGLTGLNDDEKVTFEFIDGRDGRQMAGELAKV